jgi:hypothetical protein
MSASRPRNIVIEPYYLEQFRKTHPLASGIVAYVDKPDVTLIGERKIGV